MDDKSDDVFEKTEGGKLRLKMNVAKEYFGFIIKSQKRLEKGEN